jgi:hypothetical protein
MTLTTHSDLLLKSIICRNWTSLLVICVGRVSFHIYLRKVVFSVPRMFGTRCDVIKTLGCVYHNYVLLPSTRITDEPCGLPRCSPQPEFFSCIPVMSDLYADVLFENATNVVVCIMLCRSSKCTEDFLVDFELY